MYKTISIYLWGFITLFLVPFNSSCEGSTKVEIPQEKITQSKPLKDSLPDFDPYYTGSKAITSPYGPTSITRNILQDRNGYIWFATWEGIIRYDGNTFTNFTNKEGLRRHRVFTILEDRKGIIWFGTIGAGVYRYDGKTFTNFTTKDGLAFDKVGCIYQDKAENIWFGTLNGISRYDGVAFRNFTIEGGRDNNDINSIIEDQAGTLWLGTRGKAHCYNGKEFVEFTGKEGKSFYNVRSIIEDEKGFIWLGGNDGLWRYDKTSLMNFTTNFVGYIYEDTEGNIWTSSAASGYPNKWVLSRYDAKPLYFEIPTATQIKMEENMFFGIHEDMEGGIWLGTLNGVGHYDGNSFEYFRE